MGMGREMLEEQMYEDWLRQMEEEWKEDFVPTTWTTNRGQVMLIKDMTTNHILNCIKWLTVKHSGPRMTKMVAAFVDEIKERVAR